MAVDERFRVNAAFRARSDELTDVMAHLLGCRCDAGQRMTGLVVRRRQIAGDEYIRLARNAEIAVHFDPPRAVMLGVDPLRGGRRGNTRRPDYGRGIDVGVSK